MTEQEYKELHKQFQDEVMKEVSFEDYLSRIPENERNDDCRKGLTDEECYWEYVNEQVEIMMERLR